MRLLSVIFLFLSCIPLYADHLLGGEITYQHISDQQYRVNVTLYRDCNGSKLGGTGGGSSTSNHSDLAAAYLRTANNSSCASPNTNIGTIYLSKTSYEDITYACESANTACSNSPSFNYGIEAHYYSGVVDFEDYTSYQNCAFEIYISLSDRSNDLNTMQSGTNFFNYAYINPWLTQHSSPEFDAQPRILYNVNRTVNESVASKINTSVDSIHFGWGYPLKSVNNALNYRSGFDVDKFITPYCPSGDCSANPNASIAEGVYIDPNKGNVIFTPTNLGDMGAMVVEVEQWKLINGQMRLLSVVRRDVTVAVVLSDQNYAPFISSNDVYNFCEGDDIRIELSTSDINNDSVYLEVLNDDIFSDSTYFGNSITQSIVLKKTAVNADVGTHLIHLYASDNNCPFKGVSLRTIQVNIHPAPSFQLSVDQEFCGTDIISIDSDQGGTASLRIYDQQGNILSSINNFNSSHIFRSDIAQDITYRALFTSDLGCSFSRDLLVSNQGLTNVDVADINGNTRYCEGENALLQLSHSDHEIADINWEMADGSLYNNPEYDLPAHTYRVYYSYLLREDGIDCPITDSVDLVVNPLPTVAFTDLLVQCYGTGIVDLNTLSPSPAYGEWMLDGAPVSDGIVDWNLVNNQDATHQITYQVVDGQTFCSNSLSKEWRVMRSPEIQLRDVTVCGTSFNLRLSNSIVQPLHFGPENISWQVLNHTNAVIGTHPMADLDVQTLGIGGYNIVARNTGANGCLSEDTALITIDQGLVITTNGRNTICQSELAVDLNSYLNINAPGGGWYSSNASELLNGNMLTPSKCGSYELSYTYDAFGCYAQTTVNLEVICKPEFGFDLPTQLCQNSALLDLPAVPNGVWQGSSISNSTFDPYTPVGVYHPRLSVQNGTCRFDTVVSIEVLESVDITLGSIPASLCEGEILDLDFTKDSRSNLSIVNCNNSLVPIQGSQINYMPEECDLSNNEIVLNITASYVSTCPSDAEIVRVPYHSLPRVIMPQAHAECWPFQLSENLNLLSGVDPSIQYSITSNTSHHVDAGPYMDYSFPSAGNYDLLVNLTDVTGCANQQVFNDHFILNYSPEASFDIDKGQVISLADRQVNFKNTSTIYQGSFENEWSYKKNGMQRQFSTSFEPTWELPSDTGSFVLKLVTSSGEGCKDSAATRVRVVPDLIIYIPNAFSPNETGPSQNNEFRVICDNVSQYRIKVYNRYGQKVYDSERIEETWDGTYMGQKCDIGVYLYYIEMSNKAGVHYKFQGTVNLLR